MRACFALRFRRCSRLSGHHMATFVFLGSVSCFLQVFSQDAVFTCNALAFMISIGNNVEGFVAASRSRSEPIKNRTLTGCTGTGEAIQESQRDNGARQQLEEVVVDYGSQTRRPTCMCTLACVCETIPLRVRRDGALNQDIVRHF